MPTLYNFMKNQKRNNEQTKKQVDAYGMNEKHKVKLNKAFEPTMLCIQ